MDARVFATNVAKRACGLSLIGLTVQVRLAVESQQVRHEVGKVDEGVIVRFGDEGWPAVASKQERGCGVPPAL